MPCFAQTPTVPEVTAQDDTVVFKSKIELVQVPVVVRDKSGKAVDALQREDFQLFDKGKPQVITKFSIEKTGGKPIARAAEMDRTPDELAVRANAPPVIAPDHFVGLLFDDIHLNFVDFSRIRTAAGTFIGSNLKPTDRAAIFTTSGKTMLEFTDDRGKLNQALLRLSPHPVGRAMTGEPNAGECPPVITFVQADLILNKSDEEALRIATAEVIRCTGLPPPPAREAAKAFAMDSLRFGTEETHISIDSVRDAVRRMAVMPGQRTLILASPGFLRLENQFQEESAVIDLAIRSGVMINVLNAKGLLTFDPNLRSTRMRLAVKSPFVEAGILSDLAAGTGGAYIENANDLAKGFQDLGTSGVYYILGFSPPNLKLDGGYHLLKVTVKMPPGLTVNARAGYYAPNRLSTPDEDSKEEITQALFSREEMRAIPVDMHTQFFKASESEARLAVISRLDVRKLHFRKADGRNMDDLRIVSALFDRDGNIVQSVSKTVQLRLLDGTLQNKLDSGISLRSDFNVGPGTYVIRLVVRDSEGQTMAAQNGAIEIP